MAGKKKEEIKKYNLRQEFVCQKCGKKLEIPGPCVECGGEIFTSVYVVQEL